MALPADKRTLDDSMVLFDGPEQDPQTNTWYDCMTPELLLAGDGGAHVIAQFGAVLPDAFYSGKPGGREADEFGDILAQMAGAVRSSIFSSFDLP